MFTFSFIEEASQAACLLQKIITIAQIQRGVKRRERISNLTPSLAAYKEKMKELSMLSLICSCFSPEPRNINIYTYDGESPAAETPLAAQQTGV